MSWFSAQENVVTIDTCFLNGMGSEQKNPLDATPAHK